MHEKLLAAILQSTYDAMIAIDTHEKIVLFNEAAEKLTGILVNEALGKKVQNIIANTRLPEVLKSGEAQLYQLQDLGNTSILTNRMPVRDDDGNIIAALAVFRDVSEIQELLEKVASLDAVKTFFEGVIDSVSDAISVVNPEGKGILINRAYTLLTGLTEEEVLNKPATVDIAEGESMHLQVLKTKEPVKGVLMKVGPNKKEVVVNVSPIIVNGKLLGSVGVIRDISEIKRLTQELLNTKRLLNRAVAKYTFEDIVGKSPQIRNAIKTARQYAETKATVLLTGESGTGKELFAHAIHQAGGRANKPFIRVNCAALTETLLESELFGYVEGAFTGAKKGGKVGIFEEADKGTLFLDEIAELSIGLQSKLLRVLQEKEIVRVGGTRPIPIDVRIIAATNVDLSEQMKKKLFREDLYYRLNMAPLYIPPLHERKEDIPELIGFLITKFNREFGRDVANIDNKALDMLVSYRWPGNIRELENILGRAIINMRSNERIITPEHVPLLTESGKTTATNHAFIGTYEEMFLKWEKEMFEKVLDTYGGNKTAAANFLGISVRNLYYRLQKHNLA